jgi:hypothetical protein
MQVRPTLYLESTIPSYLAGYPSRDLITAAHQQITHEWWRTARQGFEIFISEAVLDEIRAGDPGAVARRLTFTEGLPILTSTDEVEALALEYQASLRLPQGARLDAVHLAYAVVYEVSYFLTWNCTHLANGLIIQRLQAVNITLGHKTPIIITPEELLPPSEGE